MAGTCAGVVLLIFMGFSRVYLGVHSINQVIFGTLLGITFAFLGHYKVKPLFLSSPEYLYSDTGGSKYGVTCLSHFKAMIYGYFIPMLIATMILLTADDMAFYHTNEWRYRNINAGCSEDDLKPVNSLHYLHFQRAGVIAICAGAFVGQFFEYRWFINTGIMNNSPWLWYKSQTPKILIRLAITSALLIICFAPRLFTGSMATIVSDDYQFSQALLYSIFDITLPCFAASFVAFGLLRFIFHKMKLDNEMASQGEFQTREQYLREIGLEFTNAGHRSQAKKQ